MNESENYLDQLLNAVDGRSDLNDSDPVNPEEIESKEQMPQKSTRETIDIPDSNDLFMDQFEQELRKDNDPDDFLKQFEQELDRDESSHESADLLALGQRNQIFLLLFLSAVGENRP